MHSPNAEVVEVVVGEHYAADQHSDDSAQLEIFGNHVTPNSKEVAESSLHHLALSQEPASFEQI